MTITIYTTSWCGFCRRAKMLLDEKQLDYDEIDIEARPDARAEMQAQGAGHSVPQVFIDDRPIGGCDELYTLDASGRLDKIISGAA